MRNDVVIIAEAGVNHNGSIENALKMVDVAVDAGADYIKFQTFKAENLVTNYATKTDYQKINLKDNIDSQIEMLKKLELSYHDHEIILNYCNKKKIKFLSTAFDNYSLEYLKSIGLNTVKIPSGEITNLPYLRKASILYKEVIISTGMSSIQDIQNCLDVFLKEGIAKDKITILHCNSEYPTPMEDVNLYAMLHLKDVFKTNIGYSDHTLGIEVPIAAVALGASIIEKHFTLDRNMDGPDHKASLEPHELKTMVNAIRNIEKALGSINKNVTESEKKNITAARKSIVALTSIKKGDLFTEYNLTVKRPGNGISPMLWESVIGQKSKRNYNPDDIIEMQ